MKRQTFAFVRFAGTLLWEIKAGAYKEREPVCSQMVVRDKGAAHLRS